MMIQTDPFRDLDTLFSRLSGRQQNTGGVMPMDAFRRGSDVWVHIDLPGVKADSLDITVERNVLTIAAERNWQRQETDQPYFGERYRGAFRRQIQLGEGLDLQNFCSRKFENIRRAGHARGTEGFRVPALDDDNGSFDRRQVRRSERKGQGIPALHRARIEHEEIYVVLLAAGLRDVFTMLPDEEPVQLEIFTDNIFTDGAHAKAVGMVRLRRPSAVL